jgi:acyl CoA:acetate/3-ketoacid CoA transferase
MAHAKFMSADEAIAMICDGDTVAIVGGGGDLEEAAELFAAVERRLQKTSGPRNLSLVHSLGVGDRKTRGVSCFAHEGLVRKVTGGHWVWSPRMQELARANKIEAYVLPGGVVMQLYREIGARRPGLISRVGLGTFVDPRLEGAENPMPAEAQRRGAATLRRRAFQRKHSSGTSAYIAGTSGARG